jgi:hypothetical protein
MEQINCYAFLRLGQVLQQCYSLARSPLRDWIANADSAEQVLFALLRGGGFFRFEHSRPAAERVRSILERVASTEPTARGQSLTPAEVDDFNGAIADFLAAAQQELSRAPIFFVTQKGVYDTGTLINNAAAVYDDLRPTIPSDAIDDTNQAGRCLAFTLPTAAGFHIARATEAVMLKYMAACECPPLKESQRNWGKYIDALKEKNADAAVLHHLTQLKDLHRNPLIHPEVTLTMQEANSLWSMCTSVIQAMAADARRRQLAWSEEPQKSDDQSSYLVSAPWSAP